MNQEKMKTGPRRTFDWGRFAADYSALIAFVVLFVLAVIFRGFTFLNPTNLLNILRNNSIIGIISLGMTLIIIIGGIDLSVGSQLALSGLICLQVTNTTGNMFFGMLAGIAATIVFGILTGALIAHFNIPAFIVTLGTLTIYRSVAQYFFKGGGVLVSEEMRAPFTAISNSDFLGIPMPIIYWLILSVLVAIYVSRTATGRYIYAVGSNEKATRLSGINTNRVKVIVFAISALLVSLAAIVEASRLGSMNSASSGSSYADGRHRRCGHRRNLHVRRPRHYCGHSLRHPDHWHHQQHDEPSGRAAVFGRRGQGRDHHHCGPVPKAPGPGEMNKSARGRYNTVPPPYRAKNI